MTRSQIQRREINSKVLLFLIMCVMIRRRGISVSLALFTLIASLFNLIHAAPLVLFEDTNFRGLRTELRLESSPSADSSDSCMNIRGKLNDFFSSVEHPGDCYLLCEHEFCRGRCIPITQAIPNLAAIGFNDAASSVKRCPASPSSTPSSTSTTEASSLGDSSEASTSTTTGVNSLNSSFSESRT